MPIRVLDPTLAAQIAAGEVVERPASVVKELIENSVDAGATEIRVEAREGGKRELRIQDNGSGIPSDEVETAFLRHATSKVTEIEDLFSIRTLGFRGEALPSIASVAQVTCLTRTADDEVGTELRIAGGEIQAKTHRGCSVGTTFTIRNLFYNTPARLKFMRSDATEMSQISTIVTQYALAYPNIRWTLLLDGKLALQTPGNGRLLDALIELYGIDVGREMISVDRTSEAEDETVRVHGFVSQPSTFRAARSYMHLFVNQRWIKPQGNLVYMIEEAYHTLLMKGRHPIVALNIELEPEAVDVNVHPTKSEVKFRNQSHVYGALTKAVREALAAQSTIRAWTGFGANESVNRRVELRSPNGERRGASNDAPLFDDAPVAPRPQVNNYPDDDFDSTVALPPIAKQARFDTPPTSQSQPSAFLPPQQQAFDPAYAPSMPEPGEAKLPMLRVVGQVNETYIVAESSDGMYLVDQHAAHERVVYERLMAEHQDVPIERQTLMLAQPIELPPAVTRLLSAHLADLEQWGFEAEEFGEGTLMLRAVPSNLHVGQIATALMEIADHLSYEGGATSDDRREKMLTTIACHSSIRAGKTLTHEEMRQLLQQLERCEMPRTCPHGRPTMLQITQGQIERQFGRKG
ncbi:DNA mismatch repair endonuclease MutL [Herpetosiphon giganteus]|uniref:DNA mismatch repair endonuclease MutL n=1 Tax=Herpetosiphon giganteus TaxID=2029754 RepID=UPI00195D7AAB|nr:DNA mismatch repair endonuclease MutL [Herpetosiphon giganteus]MBM7842554.1 DNA mismatch repair protein MutL [Herpetosiphon giganteus]